MTSGAVGGLVHKNGEDRDRTEQGVRSVYELPTGEGGREATARSGDQRNYVQVEDNAALKSGEKEKGHIRGELGSPTISTTSSVS